MTVEQPDEEEGKTEVPPGAGAAEPRPPKPKAAETAAELERLRREAQGFSQGIAGLDAFKIEEKAVPSKASQSLKELKELRVDLLAEEKARKQSQLQNLSQEELVEKTIGAALKEPEVMKKVAEKLSTLEKEPQAHTERSGDDPLQRIIADVERAGALTRQRGKREITVSGRQVAEEIRKLLRVFQSEEFNVKDAAERERTMRESIDILTTDERLRADLRAAFGARGWLAKRKETEVKEPSSRGTEKFSEADFAGLEERAVSLFKAFEEKLNQTPTFETFVPFLIDSDGVAQLQKYFEELAETAKGMPTPPVSIAALEKIASDIKLWGENQLTALQGGTLADDPAVLKNLVAGLGSVFDALPVASPTPTPEPIPTPVPPTPEPTPPTPSSIPGAPPPSLPPMPFPSAEVSPHDALMAGLPVREAEPPSEHDRLMAGLERIAPSGAPTPPEAPKAPETVIHTPSPDAAQTKPILDASVFDVGAAMDVAGFPEFLAEAERSGAKIDMADEGAVRRRFEAFAQKDALAGKVAELCSEKILGERGIALGDEGAAAVREYLERQAHLHPEALATLAQKFARFDTLSADVATLNADIAKFQAAIPPEAERRQNIGEVLAANKKLEVLEMARKTNHWFKGAGRTHALWQWIPGNTYSKERARALREAFNMGMREKGVGAVLTFTMGLSTKKLAEGLGIIEREIAEGVEKMKAHRGDAALLAQIERKKREGEALVASAKQEIVFDKDLTDKLILLTNRKLVERLNVMKAPDADVAVDDAEQVFELLERAETMYRKSPSGNKHLEGIDPKRDLEAIEGVIDASVWKEIEKAFGEVAALPSGRFSRLEQELERFAAKERLGKKGKQQIREFIIKRLALALEGLEKERKGLEAQPKGDERVEMEKKKRQSELSQKKVLIQSLIARERKKLASERAASRPPTPPTPPSPPSPPTPPSVPPEAPPAPPSAPTPPTPEAPIPPVSSSVPPPAPERVPETPKVLNTFEDIFRLDVPHLQKVARAVSAHQLVDVLSEKPPQTDDEEWHKFVGRVLGSLTEAEQSGLEGLLKRNPINSPVYMQNMRNRFLLTAQEVLAKETLQPPPETPPSAPEAQKITVEDVPSPESEGTVPIRTAETSEGSVEVPPASSEIENAPVPSTPTGDIKVPLMITRDMEQQLADKGLSKEERNKLTPADAWKILNAQGSASTEKFSWTPEKIPR